MVIFNFFGKKETVIRDFHSDAGDFSMEEISKWMKEVQDNPDLIPPLLNDDYTSSLIERLGNESDITIVNDTTQDGIRSIALSIERNSADAVNIQYALYNPNVIYLTTGCYPFAGDSLNFNFYALHLISGFPFIQLGANDTYMYQEIPGFGKDYEDVYAVRTILPLLGGENDYKNLVETARCLPIYGYDLKDGFHSGNLQPYANNKGINVQLAKLQNIFTSTKASNEIPAIAAFWGDVNMPSLRPIKVSNEYVAKINPVWKNAEVFGGVESELDIAISCVKRFKNIWSISTTTRYNKNSEEDKINLINFLGEFNFPFNSLNENSLGLYQAYPVYEDENSMEVYHSMVGCIPNEVNAKVVAWQIARFLSIINKFKNKD